MGYRLALAEKPSVAQAIAKVLGATKRCDGYLEGNGWLVRSTANGDMKTFLSSRRNGSMRSLPQPESSLPLSSS